MRNAKFPYLPKDFIETDEGLIFAVVSYQAHEDKVGCFLRYIKQNHGWQKVTTDEANQLLADNYPHYLYQSPQFDAVFHAVAISNIVQHYRPEHRLPAILAASTTEPIECKLQRLLPILEQFGVDRSWFGLTGSMLIGCQTEKSDIDLVIYGREQFHKTREALAQAVTKGQLTALDNVLMLDNFQRRAGELDFDEFAWHENRKCNKAVINGTKFDIAMVNPEKQFVQDNSQYQKVGSKIVIATVTNDEHAFDFPAHYQIDDSETPDVLVYTHTYVGQAKRGEKVEVSAAIECNIVTGQRRLIVGSSREAAGEYIRVYK